jgi:hypothetical protein
MQKQLKTVSTLFLHQQTILQNNSAKLQTDGGTTDGTLTDKRLRDYDFQWRI